MRSVAQTVLCCGNFWIVVEAFSALQYPWLSSRQSRAPDSCERKPQASRRLTSLLFQSTKEEPIRAGSDGYSVLRQPANWDLDRDPEFAVPELLKDSSDGNRLVQLDEEWWSMSNSKAAAASSPLKSNNIQPKPQQRRVIAEVEMEEEPDLVQRTLDTLDFPRVLKALYNECTTVPAKRIVQDAMTSTDSDDHKEKRKKRWKGKIPVESERAYQPLTADSVEGSQERYKAVQEMECLLQGGNGRVRINETAYYRNRLGYKETLGFVPPPLAGNGFNLEIILDQAAVQARVLEGPDILEVSDMLDTLENIMLWNEALQRVEDLDFVELSAIASCITVNTTLQDLLHKAFDKDGRLSGTTFPTIGRLRARVRSLKADIMGTLDGLLAVPSIKSKLSLESGGPVYSEVQGGRLVIPVDRKYASSVGIVHDTSRSGKTVYVEPNEIIGPTNELRQSEGELRAEEARVWRSLTEQIINNRVALETAVAAVGQLDLVLARLMLGRKISGSVPLVRDEGVMDLRNARHPVLLLRGVDDVVGSDIALGSGRNQGMVLTGPNAGGKTVILKLLGLMALMARSGIPVPADSAQHNVNDDEIPFYQPRVDFFSPVLADIGDLQSVGGDLSTFSGHMLVCREVLNNSGRNALVLMDELGSGTDPNQGVAIAQALLEAVIETGARVAITTHYMQLKQLAASDDRFSVAGMQFVNGRPTYKLLPGTVGESFALAVAERLGLPQAVLRRANELLDSETRQMGDLIREMEDQKALVDQQVEELERKRKEMASMELSMKEERIRLENKQLSARRDEARKFAKMLEEKEAILEDILEKLKADPSRRIVAKSWDDIKFVKRDALNEAENVPSVMARKQKVAAAMEEASADLIPIAEMREKPELKEGDKVIICQQGSMFGREASVIKALDTRVEVKVNNINVSFKFTQVAIATGNAVSIPHLFQPVGGGAPRKSSRSRAVEQALAAEGNTRVLQQPKGENTMEGKASSGVTMRTESNTVDVRGCNLSEAQEKVRDKFSSCLMGGRSVVYILHGHGTGGVLKSKIRAWLNSEKMLVKQFGPADRSDGGDAFTRVDLR